MEFEAEALDEVFADEPVNASICLDLVNVPCFPFAPCRCRFGKFSCSFPSVILFLFSRFLVRYAACSPSQHIN